MRFFLNYGARGTKYTAVYTRIHVYTRASPFDFVTSRRAVSVYAISGALMRQLGRIRAIFVRHMRNMVGVPLKNPEGAAKKARKKPTKKSKVAMGNKIKAGGSSEQRAPRKSSDSAAKVGLVAKGADIWGPISGGDGKRPKFTLSRYGAKDAQRKNKEPRQRQSSQKAERPGPPPSLQLASSRPP